MAEVPRSSFIPKQVAGATPKIVRQKRAFSVLGFISVILLFGALLTAGGTFLYKTYLGRALEEQKSMLASEYAKFSEDEIAEVRAFDGKLKLAEQLLDTHVAPSRIFRALEANTKQSVQYTDLMFERRPSGGVTLSISGVTEDFEKVSLQWMAYLRDSILAEAAMKQIALGTEETSEEDRNNTVPQVGEKQVSFALIANIDASEIPYQAVVEEVMTDEMLFETNAATGTSTDSASDTVEVIEIEPQTTGGGSGASVF